jgi:formylglycine-generating enzyme required for sulfatase activity
MALHLPRSRASLSLSISMFAVAASAAVTVAACASAADPIAGAEAEATPNPDGAVAGAECTIGFNCRSGICTEGRCAPSTAGASSSPTNGAKDGDETDVDCGGSTAGKCAEGKSCEVGGDCASASCAAGKCVAGSPTDGAKNGDETDADCGGAKASKCAVGKGCATHDDCASDACSYEKKCVAYKGCTAHFGGDTCGEGETGTAGAKHESCCTTVDIPDRPAGQGGAFTIDKYAVTAGRMRAFAERYQGNLKKWASEGPKGWDASLSASLPETMADVDILLGPKGKRGCDVVNQGGRTYFQAPVGGVAAEKSDFSKDALDEKALNCVPWTLAAAVCAFDGGHLVSASEMQWVFENRGRAGGATTYPWQFADKSGYSTTTPDIRLVHRYSYETPNPPAGMRLVNGQYPLDHSFYVAPPGRRPKGANMHGVQDAAGNVMPWVRDARSNFIWTQSWEKHEKNLVASNWAKNADGPDGYYAIGARCSY